jgi:NADP-dependent 3-hydroxy acid dehydrogenase YdfG
MGTQNAKVWLVTGCSTGLGRYIDEHLLEAGEKGVVTARKTDKVADFQQNGEALILPLDVIDRDQCRQVLEAAKVHVGRIDVVINNAGIGFFDAID